MLLRVARPSRSAAALKRELELMTAKAHSEGASMNGIARFSLLCIAFTYFACIGLAAQTTPPSNEKLSPEELRARGDWRVSMAQVPLPKKGCFQSAYPSREWREVTCTTTPKYPQPPRHGARPLTVGNNNDVSPQTPTGFIFTT